MDNKTCSCKASKRGAVEWRQGSLGPHPAHLLFRCASLEQQHSKQQQRRCPATPHTSLASLSCSAAPPPTGAAPAAPCPGVNHPPPPQLTSLSSLHLSLFLSLHHPPPSHASALAIASATAPLADSPLRVPPPPPSLRRHASRPSATVGPCPTSPAASSCARAVTDWISPSFTALTTPPLFSTTLAH